MNAHVSYAGLNPEKHDLSRAIDRACAELQSIKVGLYHASIRTVELQAESAQLYASYAAEILQVSGSLHVEAVEIAAGLANVKVTSSDRAGMTSFDTARDILQDICSAAQTMIEEMDDA